jgi:hypothetical protein
VKPRFLLVREYDENIVDSRLLHPQHFSGIGIGQDQYRLPSAPLMSFQNSGAEKCQEGV